MSVSNIIKAGSLEAQSVALDLALRAAGTLKNARGLLPESLKSEGEIVAVLLAGQELGLPPMAALRGLQVVRGKVIISYDTMIALLRRAGYRIEWLEGTTTKATLRLTAPDGATHAETWDQERAKRAGLWGSATWAKYSETMLKARCVSSAARAFAGEVLAGVYVEGEIEEPTPRAAVTVEVAPVDPAAEVERQAEQLAQAFADATSEEHVRAAWDGVNLIKKQIGTARLRELTLCKDAAKERIAAAAKEPDPDEVRAAEEAERAEAGGAA